MNTEGSNRTLAFALFGVLIVGIFALIAVVILMFSGGGSDHPHSTPQPTVTVTHTKWPTNPVHAHK